MEAEVLRVSPPLLARLQQAARDRYPGEACGFLLGSTAGRVSTLTGLHPAINRATRDDRFLIDARQVYEARRAARTAKRELLGVYHSHPDGGDEPSATDAADAWGGWVHVIVGWRGDEGAAIGCWRWTPAGFVRIELETTPA